MKFLLASIWLAAVVAVAPTLALGAKPEHGYHSESFTETNFCGTGTSVDGFFESIFTASERDGGFKVEHQGSYTFSYGDASVIVSFAGQFTDTIVATEAGGVEIHQLIRKRNPGEDSACERPCPLNRRGRDRRARLRSKTATKSTMSS